jgi:hypothetical protein
MKLKMESVYGYNDQQFILIPETMKELRMLNKIQNAKLGWFSYCGMYPLSRALQGSVPIPKKGKCQNCVNTCKNAFKEPCSTCMDRENASSHFEKISNEPSAFQLLIKGLSKAGAIERKNKKRRR